MENQSKYSILCMIQGNDTLATYLQSRKIDNDIFELLVQPIIWQQVATVHPGTTSHFNYINRIKLSYLMYLWNDFVLDNESKAISNLVKELMGEPPIKQSIFDKWWILSRPLHENSEEVYSSLSSRTVAQFDMPESESDKEWFDSLQLETNN